MKTTLVHLLRCVGYALRSIFLGLPLTLALSACTVGPDYHRPSSAVSATFKELKGWKAAQPKDDALSTHWWELFEDPYLNGLVTQVNLNNQSLAQAEAQFRQAQALVQGARAAYFPTATATATTNRFRAATGQSVAVSGVRSLFGTALSIAWEPDLWGNVRRQVEANQATAQASFATLQALRLSTQATLVQSYFQLRALDAQKKILDDTVATYSKTLQITQNRYAVGVSAKSELVQAQTQVQSIQAQGIHLGVQRAQLEHAIALLLGKTPSELSIPFAPLASVLPEIPVLMPSQLLERRPDIAATERQVAAANAKIGVAKAAYFPTVNLSASNGYQSGTLSNLISSAARYWAIGPAAFALPLFDGGAKGAQMSDSIAAFDASVAAYRLAVLTGFQEVEDNLAALNILQQEAVVQQQAVASAAEALKLTSNQFQAGTVSYLNVMTAQVVALDNQKAALAVFSQRLDAAVMLIKALGGGWTTAQLPSADKVGGEAKWSQFLPIPLR
ncbi:MAG: efflux transporter outer membrane subunit [Methylococcaceae bacterium]|nr:efflux transporter outer membrane subunit [Methylococcaceae bacterium]